MLLTLTAFFRLVHVLREKGDRLSRPFPRFGKINCPGSERPNDRLGLSLAHGMYSSSRETPSFDPRRGSGNGSGDGENLFPSPFFMHMRLSISKEATESEERERERERSYLKTHLFTAREEGKAREIGGTKGHSRCEGKKLACVQYILYSTLRSAGFATQMQRNPQ